MDLSWYKAQYVDLSVYETQYLGFYISKFIIITRY